MYSVWTEGMLIDKPQPTYNPLTKPTSISLKGGRNEWVGFLICVRADETLTGFIPSVQATLTKGSDTIADTNFISYLLHNHNVTERANVYEIPGTYPDAAVPYKDVYFNEVRNGTGAGWGQTVSSGITRVFFVEIYIPTTTPVGQYTGTFRLTSNSGALSQDINITLDVWNFTLPQQWSLKNLWGIAGGDWEFDHTAFGSVDNAKARQYLFNMQKSAIMHGFFLYGETSRQVASTTSTDSFNSPYFDGASDTYSWKRFLDGTVPQGYNPKPYPKTSVFCTRDDSGTAMIFKSTAVMDAWANWITLHGYAANTLFLDKIVDEPETLSIVNAYHTAHVTRHSGHPERPMEYWTAGATSYPKDSEFWGDTFKSMWMVSQMHTWYRAHDWGSAYGSPADFDTRKATYGDLLFSYTAGDNDRDCDRDLSYNVGKNCRGVASTSLDAYSRQNAYMFLSDWHFKSAGHHFWATTMGWGNPVSTDNANTVWSVTDPYGAWTTLNGYNGDGIIFYPGRPTGTSYNIGGTHEIPIESYRMKLIRWGAQVYEYGKLLEELGQLATANSQIESLVTYNVPNTVTIASVATYDTARLIMGQALHDSSIVVPPDPPPDPDPGPDPPPPDPDPDPIPTPTPNGDILEMWSIYKMSETLNANNITKEYYLNANLHENIVDKISEYYIINDISPTGNV